MKYLLIFFVLLSIFFTACTSEKPKNDSEDVINPMEKIAILEAQLAQSREYAENLDVQLSEINTILDTVRAVDSEFYNDDKPVERQSVIDKLVFVNEQLVLALEKLEKLNKTIETDAGQSNNTIIVEAVNNKIQEVNDFQDRFSSLQRELDRYKSRTVNLKKLLEEKDNSILVMIKKQKNELLAIEEAHENRVKALKEDIDKLEKEFNDRVGEMTQQKKKEKAKLLLETGDLFFKEYQILENKGAFGKINTGKIRKQLLEYAQEKYQESDKLVSTKESKNKLSQVSKLIKD